MSLLSHRHARKVARFRRSIAVSLIVAMMALSSSPAQTIAAVAGAKSFIDSATNLFLRMPMLKISHARSDVRTRGKQSESSGQREARVARISLCPRRVLMYVGEQHTLSPLPLDTSSQAVHGVVFTYESSATQIADVATDGSLTALKPGICFVMASVGQKNAKVKVEIRDGQRPRLTNAQWESEHANDCKDPEQDPPASSNVEVLTNRDGAAKPPFSAQLPAPDSDPPPNVAGASSRPNAVGHPRFSPDLPVQTSLASTDNQLGSYNFNMSIPVFGAGGRGVGVDLNLVYNSRVWTKDILTNTMVFDYDVGWPAPGFRLNYGRIIPSYNVPNGIPNGDYLLVEADGTRTPLITQPPHTGLYRSNDGRYIEFLSTNNKLFLPNGTLIRYQLNGPNKIFPTSIRDAQGNSISISYISSCEDALRVEPCNCSSGCSRPPKQAIKQITDTLGRIATFYYYANGALAEIRAPGYNGGPDRVVARFYYEQRTITYDFGSLAVAGVPAGGQVDVLRRIYFPDTGRGYIFGSYSAYGMCTRPSMRMGMTDALDGTEVGYSDYTMQTTGVLSDSPQFTERRDWWQGKTDDSGNSTTTPATYSYSRTTDDVLKTMTNSVSGPVGPNSVTTTMVSDNDLFSQQLGLLKEHRQEAGGVPQFKQVNTYDNPSSGPGTSGLQRSKVITTDDGSPANQSRTDFAYGQYGRLITTTEYGFPNAGGNFRKRRRTEYAYVDTPSYIAATFYHLVTFITVFDAKETNDDSDDTKVAKTSYDYDNPDSGWGMQQYGFTSGCTPPGCTPPPGYDTNFVGATVRGLVTKVLRWSDATALPDISFRHQYDIFGNELKAEVSCCSVRSSTFGPDFNQMYYSAPVAITDGGTPGPTLTTGYSYDPNTGFLNSTTDPNNLTTSYAPDAAMRRRMVTYPKLAGDPNPNPTLETFYADANNNPSSSDTLVYHSKFIYFDGTQQKVQIRNQWLDGAGHTLRAGSAVGPTPSSYDAVKGIYDESGRLRKSTNPYNTAAANGDISGLPSATVYDYDSLSRVTTVTLPDSNTVTTSYSGAVTTVTDQIGRKRRTEVDGLGRTIKVTEMDANKQLTQDTSYGYDKNDNLTSVDQGGQIRAFKYDSLSRLTFERTPEEDATLSDGSGNLWSAKHTYTSFDALLTRQDPRGVVTTYGYDGLNRLATVTYTTTGTSAVATPSVTVTYGSAVPKLGKLAEIRQTNSGTTPWKESYDYDALSRMITKTVSLDNQTFSFATGYGYNQIGQLKTITYPSSRLVSMGYDSRGRLLSLSGSRSYINSVAYSPAQQTTNVNLANGVNESYGYNAQRLQLTSQSATKGATTLLSLGYSYTADQTRNGGTKTGNTGQLMDITGSIINSGIKDQSFNYDQVGRLAQASGYGVENQWQRRYTYDRWGNRTKVESADAGPWCTKQVVKFKPGLGGQPLGNRATNVQDYLQCNPATSNSMTYNETGDVTGYGARKFLYDGENRLAQVLDSVGVSGQYSYDAANRRVKKFAGGVITNYVWEGSRVIAEYDGVTGTLLAEYIYAGDRLLAREASGAVTYYHSDRLSVRMLTDGAGNWVGTQSHEPFGEQVQERDLTSKWRFTNYERDDETGSDYAVNRQYQTSAGRFGRPDPLLGTDPQSLNRYAYVGNDPVNSTDPLGLLQCYFSYSYHNFSTTVDGEDAIGIRVTLTQYCWGSAGGGGGGGTGLVTGEDGGGAGGALNGHGERVGGPKTPNQCARDCYRKALDAYNAVGDSSSQQWVDRLESLSPLSLLGVSRGVDEVVKFRTGGPAFVTRNGLQGPVVRGSIGSALKSGGEKALGGTLGKLSLGIAFIGLVTQALNPFIGREKFLRDAVDECNSGCRGATKTIDSSVFGTIGRVKDFLSRP